MKKALRTTSAVLAALLLTLLAACGHGYLDEPPTTGQSGGDTSSSSTGAAADVTGSDADYKAVVENARDSELNDLAMYAVVTSGEDALHDILFSESFGFIEEDYQRYAISASSIITQAYGVMVILPKEGKTGDVLQQVEAFVEQQQNAMENYLQDQYEIASAAIIKQAPTGEVLLAMCEDAPAVMEKLEAGLQ